MSYENRRPYLMNKYPGIQDLEIRAKKRIPKVAWAYLSTGTGAEDLLQKNLNAFSNIRLIPQFCKGSIVPKIETKILGQTFSAPFGIAPVGLTGLMWPRAEVIFGKTAKKYQIPACLSTLATETPETVGPHIGSFGWFQLYAPKEKGLRKTLMNRARNAGFHTLVITVDIPIPSKRERTKRAGLSTPPKITPRFIWDGITHPSWTIGTLKNGLPSLRTVEDYSDFKSMMSVGEFVQHQMGGNLSWDLCREIRDEWDGPIIVKGLLHPKDAEAAVSIGMDGIVVSNHGARQFDGAPTSIDALPEIIKVAKGKTAILLDSGIRSGLDILRALSLGAEFVLLGRAFMYGVAALGKLGGDHVAELLIDDLKNNMIQMGVENFDDLAH